MATIGRRRLRNITLLCISYCFALFTGFSSSQYDILAQGQELKDGIQLFSASGIFTLGFYKPGRATTSYLGIWYNRYNEKPVWIANRNFPILNSSGILTIDDHGSLKILCNGGNDSFILHSVQEKMNTSAILMNTGNFVLRQVNPDGTIKRELWQSFDYPTDTLLPGMKLGINRKSGVSWSLTSWRSEGNPALGSFTFGLGPNHTNQLAIWLRGNPYWTSGSWQNGCFEFIDKSININGHKSSIRNYGYNFIYFSNENETYFTYSSIILTRGSAYDNGNPELTLNSWGELKWQGDGNVVSCSFNDYSWDSGCLGKRKDSVPSCNSYHRFLQNIGFMSGDGLKFKGSDNMTLYECGMACISNCSCVAYAPTNDDGTGCEIWDKGVPFIPHEGKNLDQMQDTDSRNAETIWIFENIGMYWDPYFHHTDRTPMWIIVAPAATISILMLGFICYFIWRKNKGKIYYFAFLLYELGFKSIYSFVSRRKKGPGQDWEKDHGLQFFSFESIVSATSNFAAAEKLGEGGFGSVYKGRLPDGQEVAIKRLSRNSTQGLLEFKNEAILISKLQHTNLVRLVGCCIHRQEKLLIYEFLSNKSLDYFLFNPERKNVLDWKKRFNIIQRIVQGLVYLHNYSRLRIIHRDLKVSNILLDNEMNAKISDFGMAKIFGPTDSEANTSRVAGTFGYMSPEYVRDGVFSTKSDVYSFGILLLEIVTGRRNYNNYDSERPINLAGHAWELWINGRGAELIDSIFRGSNYINEALRCIHVGLLCAQENATDRPNMLDVVFMIYNDATHLPQPKQPAFFIGRSLKESEMGEFKMKFCSLNRMSISDMDQAR